MLSPLRIPWDQPGLDLGRGTSLRSVQVKSTESVLPSSSEASNSNESHKDNFTSLSLNMKSHSTSLFSQRKACCDFILLC